MNTLRAYLWKEWRDQRAIVLGFLLAIPVPLVVLAFVLPANMSGHPIYLTVVGLGAIAIAALALGSDLIPGERRRGTIEFLRRLPAGLGTPLAAKLIVYVGSAVLFGAYAFLVAGALGGRIEWSHEMVQFPLAIPVVLLWILAVSSWIPRGVLAWPAAAVTLALLAVPVYLLEEKVLGNPLRPGDFEAWAGYLVLAGGVVLAFSFLRGFRFGSATIGAAWRGALAALVLTTPVCAYSGWRAVDSRQLDLDSDSFRFWNACVGADGRLLFVNARRDFADAPNHPVIVDLEDGSWRRAGEVQSWFRAFAHTRTSEFVVLDAGATASRFDSRTGEVMAEAADEDWYAWYAYHRSPVTLRDGSMARAVGTRILGGEGEVLAVYACGVYPIPTGHGWRINRPGNEDADYFDPTRRREYSVDLPDQHYVHKIRSGEWLVGSRGDWSLYDPDSEESRTLPGTQAGDRLLTMMVDERLLFRRGRVLLVCDPDRESWQAIFGEFEAGTVAGFTPSGAPVLRRGVGKREMQWARLDLQSLRIEYSALVANHTYQIAIEERSLLVTRRPRVAIERVPFGDGPIETVFPKRSKS